MKHPSYSLQYSILATSFFYVLLAFYNAEAVVKLPKNETVPAIFAFGDSIVDQGNNNKISTLIKCNFPPYGKDLMDGVSTGRFTNGRTPLDMISKELGIKDLVPAYLDPHLHAEDLLTGLSFASGGSGYDPQTSQIASVISLRQQLEMFKKYIGQLKEIVGEEKANFILANSIYFLVCGSDDLANTYYTIGIRRVQYDVNSYADLMVTSAFNFIKELYELGARRIGVFSVPPIGCVPSQRTLSGGALRFCVEDHNQAAQLVNSKLSSAIHSLNQMLSQSKIVYIDIYNSLLDIIQNPQIYGLEVVDRGCCGTGEIEVSILCNPKTLTCPDSSKFLFWDSYHPTEQGYKLLVQELLQKYIYTFF